MITIANTGHLTIQSGTKAMMRSSIKIMGTDTNLPITIEADFAKIPTSLHHIYLQALMSSYGDTNVFGGANKEPKTVKEKKREWRLDRIVDIIISKLR